MLNQYFQPIAFSKLRAVRIEKFNWLKQNKFMAINFTFSLLYMLFTGS